MRLAWNIRLIVNASAIKLLKGLQYAYSCHVINLPLDIPSFVNSLPRQPFDLNIVIVRERRL